MIPRGSLDQEDALIAFNLNTSSMAFEQVTPSGATVLTHSRDRQNDSVLYRIRKDSNGDGEFTLADESDVLESKPAVSGQALPFLDRELLEQLLARLN